MGAVKKKEGTSSISKAKSLEQIGDFWDKHSLADYWDKTREAAFTVRATRRRRIAIDPEVYSQIEALAHRRGVSPETLVNLWVIEGLRKGRQRPKAGKL